MASSKGVLRSIVVLAMILTSGFLGLWFLRGSEINIKNQSASPATVKAPLSKKTADPFSEFGGKTPQETLKFFIAALEKNDLTLAAKYFIPENMELTSENLTRLENTNLLSDLLNDLKNIKSGRAAAENRYYFEIIDENGQTAAELELIKNQNGFWKIISL